jgi:hypothetical protein
VSQGEVYNSEIIISERIWNETMNVTAPSKHGECDALTREMLLQAGQIGNRGKIPLKDEICFDRWLEFVICLGDHVLGQERPC